MSGFLRFSRTLLILVFSVILYCSSQLRADAEEMARYAILMGNSAYPDTMSLPNPVNDSRALANVLVQNRFHVTTLEDGTLDEMRKRVRDTVADVPDGALVIFYYAGHAIQRNGVNLLLPVDFSMDDKRPVVERALGVDEVMAEIDKIPNVTKVIVLDACRDFPLGDASEALGNGLASVLSQGETMIAYATLSGDVAYDGNGPNSPFTGALISALDIPGLELYDLFRTVRYKVRSATDGRQLPWVSGTLQAKIVLNPTVNEITAELVPLENLDPIEAVSWSAISRSGDPNDFRTFLAAFASSPARTIAEQKIEELSRLQPVDFEPLQIPDEPLPGAPFVITACDKWVSDPLDPSRLAPGVAWGLVNTRYAIRDCSIALSKDPDNPRLFFLLARALDIAEDFDNAIRFYEQASAKGYGVASRNLGYMYRNARGVRADDSVAARYYFRAAELGVVDARKALAKLYEEGWGVEQSYPEMMRWLELSAEDNYPNSLDHLGNLYRTGTYVEKDEAKALEYYKRGAAMGYGNAISNLARMYRDGLGVAVGRQRAMELYQLAVDGGNAFAPYHLARMLLQPEDGEVADPARALELLELSAERGYSWALWQLARGWYNGDFGKQDLETAAFYLWIAAETGRSMRNDDGEKLAQEATNLLREIEPNLSQDRRDAIEERTQLWLKQNSLLDFSLLFPY